MRQNAPNDELQFDDDPEETYGIVDNARAPKPAFAAVKEMFAEALPATATAAPSTSNAQRVEGGIISLIVALAIGTYVWSRRSAA